MKYHYFYRADFKTEYNRGRAIVGVIATDNRLLADNGSWPRFTEAVAKDITDAGHRLYGIPNITSVSFLHATDDEQPTSAPVLTVECEPDYWSGGHYHEGTKPYIDPTAVWGLPIGTKLYTAPIATEQVRTEG